MSGYTKLFNSILASTVWSEPNEVRIVWITMLAMANKDGIVEGSIPGLAVFARLPLDATETALDRLSSPDRHSRSKELDGRRIQSIEGGWQLVNHSKYRQQMSADERREYLRIKQAEHRARKKLSTSVNDVSDKSTKYTHTAPAPDTEEDPKANTVTTKQPAQAIGAVTTSNGNGARPHLGGPIIGRNTHLDHAACDDLFSYCVPSAVHRKFADLLAPKHAGDREEAKAALQAWYPTVWATIPVGTVMGDAFRFWQIHFDTAFATPAPKKKTKMSVEELTERVRADMKAAGELS